MINYCECGLTEIQYYNIFRYNWGLNLDTLHAIAHASNSNSSENVKRSKTYLHEGFVCPSMV
jgi:hypothetical protein